MCTQRYGCSLRCSEGGVFRNWTGRGEVCIFDGSTIYIAILLYMLYLDLDLIYNVLFCVSDLRGVWHHSDASLWILWSWVSKPRDGVEMSSLSPNQLETQTPPQVGCHPSSLIFFCCPQTLLQIFWTRYTICTSAFSSTDSMLTYLYRVSTFFSNVFQISSSLFLKSCLLWLII